MESRFWWWPSRYRELSASWFDDTGLLKETWGLDDENWLAIREQRWAEREGLA